MIVRVKLFAAAKEIAGSDELVVDLPADATIADVRQAIVGAMPSLERVVSFALFAMNAEYADDGVVISEDDEVALIPPVSGG